MKYKNRTIGFVSSVILLFLIGCNDKPKNVKKVVLNVDQSEAANTLIDVGEIRYNGQNIDVRNIAINGTKLHFTGPVYGAIGANVGSNPEAPILNYALRDHQSGLLQGGCFRADELLDQIVSIGALTAFSGIKGLSLFSEANVQGPIEVLRRPTPAQEPNGCSGQIRDAAFSGIPVIVKDKLYIFKREGYVLTYQISSNNLSLLGRDDYDPSINCCAVSAATYQDKYISVAFGSALVTFEIGSNGRLIGSTQYEGLNPAYLSKTERALYVYHKPIYQGGGSSSGQPEGVYRLPFNNAKISYYSGAAEMFAVYNDTHFYSFFPGSGNILIQRISSTNP